MQLCVTDLGIGRRNGDEIEVLDTPYPDLGMLLRNGLDIAAAAPIRTKVAIVDAKFEAPVTLPSHLVLNGLIYRGHAEEAGFPTPTEPSFALAQGGPLDPPVGTVRIPPDAPVRVDYEGEVAIVIGSTATGVSANEAWRCIAGFMLVNDISERAAQLEAMAKEPWDVKAMGKSKRHPTFKPSGPYLTTRDEFTEDHAFELTTRLNGHIVQHDSTANMLFGFSEIVAAISQAIVLEVGDVICTGTPAGSGIGRGRYLVDGDIVEVSVPELGCLVSRVTS
jgi:2-keto-4-pentenoate hydratase/2-oxohepta-3-ene-1,7-dioic acid hydratase in catechol pathway